MKITYIGHSGFLLEWETCYWLFDYYKGEIPLMSSEKKIFIFSSHKHADHYNPEIFRLGEKYRYIEFILSSDIKMKEENYQQYSINDELRNHIVFVKPSQEYELQDSFNNIIYLKTLKSTDSGVAFLLQFNGKTIYHAGDLNLWVWKGETKQYNHNMTAMFQKEMDRLSNIPIDIAFVPLDPRQEEWYYMGLEKLLNTAKVRNVCPMHFWNEPDIIQQFMDERSHLFKDTNVIEIREEGQTWTMKI